MTNANVNLPYNVTKQIKVTGYAADGTTERPLSNIAFTKSIAAVTISGTGDAQVFNVLNTSNSQSATGTIFWSAQNELGNPVIGQTPITQVAPNPATQIGTTEL